jgi:hypothetical protein
MKFYGKTHVGFFVESGGYSVKELGIVEPA